MVLEQDRERGNITPTLIMLVFVVVVILGLMVDGGGKISASVQSQQLAASAARAGANALSSDAVANGGRGVDAVQARNIASQAVAAGGGTSTVTVRGDTVTVTVIKRYRTVFLPMLGIKSLQGSGTASARIVTE